jgi:hypothetical protein
MRTRASEIDEKLDIQNDRWSWNKHRPDCADFIMKCSPENGGSPLWPDCGGSIGIRSTSSLASLVPTVENSAAPNKFIVHHGRRIPAAPIPNLIRVRLVSMRGLANLFVAFCAALTYLARFHTV